MFELSVGEVWEYEIGWYDLGVANIKVEVGNFDSICVIIDRLTKSTHFIPNNLEKLAKTYIQEIVWLHGIPICINFDKRT